MTNILESASLRHVGLWKNSIIYRIENEAYTNEYFIVSSEGTRSLMASPEVVGFNSYLSMVPGTLAAMEYLKPKLGNQTDILTILRGGLNYPLEECCYRAGIIVRDMQFLSCERIIENNVIKGLDIKYEKLSVHKNCNLMVGDIIATGDTLRLCLEHIIDSFSHYGGSIKRIIFFTIGGTRAIEHMEELSPKIHSIFPDFEGFTCVFYEGVFGVYQDKGCTGVNVPQIDFGWKNGIVSPEFRSYILQHGDAIFEKCIIYDGGARRYEIPEHCKEVIEYWEDLLEASDHSGMDGFTEEKLGHKLHLDKEDWTFAANYTLLPDMTELYFLEQEFTRKVLKEDLKSICERRLHEFKTIMKEYIR